MPRLTAGLLELQQDDDLPVGMRSMWFEFLYGSPFDAMPEARGSDSIAVGNSGRFRRVRRTDRLEVVLSGHVNGNGDMGLYRQRMQELQDQLLSDNYESLRPFTLTLYPAACGDNEALEVGETAELLVRLVRWLPGPRSKSWFQRITITLESVSQPPVWTFTGSS